MPQEIELRSWWESTKCMAYFEEPYFTWNRDGKIGIFIPRVSGNVCMQQSIDMLYTGLKDKNGKKIYEGDIIAFTDDYGEIQKAEVIYGECKFYVIWEPDSMFCISSLEDIEVLGNIYENPDILSPTTIQ